MGRIEITDGVGMRRIRVEEFAGTINVDLAGEEPVVELPEGVTVRRRREPVGDERPSRRVPE